MASMFVSAPDRLFADLAISDKVVLVGDTHANGGFAADAVRAAHARGVSVAFQLGDFGFWPRDSRGRNFLGRVSAVLESRDMCLLFADGNHEDHEMLPHFEAAAPVELAEFPRIVWVPRGVTVTLGADVAAETTVMFFGGAVSVDQHHRTPGYDWFPTEVASRAHWERAFAHPSGSVDVVVAHDVPFGVDLRLDPIWPEKFLTQADAHRRAITELCDHLSPRRWFAGHYHQRASGVRRRTALDVFPHDTIRIEDACAIFDLRRDSLTPLSPPPRV